VILDPFSPHKNFALPPQNLEKNIRGKKEKKFYFFKKKFFRKKGLYFWSQNWSH
jgi:hypothetical protein